MDEDRFVTVATYETLPAITVAMSMLEAQGVPSHSPFLELARLFGGLPRHFPSMELRVAARDEALARALLRGTAPDDARR